MEKKTNRGLICLVVVLIIICLVLTGFILVDKGIIKFGSNKEKVVEKVKKNNFEELAVDDKLVTQSLAKINWKIEDFYKNDKLVVSDIDNDVILSIAFASIVSENKDVSAVSTVDLDKNIKNIFGSKTKYTTSNSVDVSYAFIGCSRFTYDEKDSLYTREILGCDAGWRFNGIVSKVNKALKYDDRIEIYQKAMYYTSGSESTGPLETIDFYKANVTSNPEGTDYYDKSALIAENVKNPGSGTEFTKTMNLDDYYEKADTYKIIFTKENNNYVFTSIEILK